MPVRLALAIILAGTLNASAQTPVAEHVPAMDMNGRMSAFQDLIARYHAGDESAVQALRGWSSKQLAEVVAHIQTRDDPVPHWETWRFRAASMLLTDAAIRSADNDIQPPDAHLKLVLAILKRGGRDVTPFAVAWVSATASWLRRQHAINNALGVLDEARGNWPDAPELWYQTGITREISAIAYANLSAAGPPPLEMTPAFGAVSTNPLSPRPTWAAGRNASDIRDRAHRELDGSRDMLARAVKNDPHDVRAHVHLARVLLLEGRSDEALAAANQAEDATDDALGYLASLMAGAAEEGSGRLDAALQHYRRAVDRFPAGQFGYVALAEASGRAGRTDDARAAIARMLDRRRTGRLSSVDPWWLFAWESADGVTDPFTAVRTEARR